MSEQQQTINPAYAKYDTMTAEELVRAMAELRADKDRREEELKVVNAEFDFLRLIKIPAKFEETGVSNIKLTGIGRCNLTGDLQVGFKSEKKADALQWLRDTGRGDLIKEDVNSSTLKAMVKDMLQKGEELPDEFFRLHVFSRASITKA